MMFAAHVAEASLQITSPAFHQNGRIPQVYTCDGRGSLPPLNFHDVPPGSKGLALIVEDPDVPRILKTDGVFVHWIRWNIAPESSGLASGQAGGGDNNGSGPRFIPPCPPDSMHRYVFTLFALDTVLTEEKISSAADLRRAMEGHVIAQSELVGQYRRPISWFVLIGVVVSILFLLAAALVKLSFRFIRLIIARGGSRRLM
jgi:Raf kinase inhibitor-like YbhB/YbcL family protein